MPLPQQASLHILIADDQKDFRKIIRHYLSKRFDNIYECTDGLQAVQHYMKSQIDIVVMDIEMPIMDGITAAANIRSYDPKACIVIQSSHTSKDYRARAIQSGASVFVSKARLKEIPHIFDVLLKRRICTR